MTLLGHKAKNHPQQVGRSGSADDVDDRATDWSPKAGRPPKAAS